MSIVLDGTSGITTPSVQVNGVATNLYPLVSGTAVTASGTSVDFTGIPSWVKRITVVFSEVSTNGSSAFLIQLGSGTIQATGYVSTGGQFNGSNVTAAISSTAGNIIRAIGAANSVSGLVVLTLLNSNTWVSLHTIKPDVSSVCTGAGTVTLGGTLDRIRITTVNGTDVFDAGTINIMYE